MIHDAHAFRGEYIDLCAQIERWAVEVLRSNPAQRSGKAPKMPHLLGQKLKLIDDLAADDTVFARPARIRGLLEQLGPLIRLRADLAHATLSMASDGTEQIYAFELPAAEPGTHGRFWLRRDETAELLAALKKGRKELGDQKLRG